VSAAPPLAKGRRRRVFFLQSQNRDPTVNQLLGGGKIFAAESDDTE
jgi:hypothetical protein